MGRGSNRKASKAGKEKGGFRANGLGSSCIKKHRNGGNYGEKDVHGGFA